MTVMITGIKSGRKIKQNLGLTEQTATSKRSDHYQYVFCFVLFFYKNTFDKLSFLLNYVVFNNVHYQKSKVL